MTNKEKVWAADYATITPYNVVNHNMVRTLGANAALLLSFLSARQKVLGANGWLGPEESFYTTIGQVQEALGLSEDQQRAICTKLVNLGYITVERRGKPARRTFTINAELFRRCAAGEFVKKPQTR